MPKDDQDITLRDVITHIQAVRNDMGGMEKRISKKIDANAEAIAENKKAIVENKEEIQKLGRSITSLGEDLTATIQDTVSIRRHVGMSVASE